MADGDLKSSPLTDAEGRRATVSWPPHGALAAHRSGAPWSEVFAALIASELAAIGRRARYLDVGAGAGLDGDLDAQRRVARRAAWAVAVEPDGAFAMGAHFQESHRRRIEGAPLQAGKVDVAAALHVLEAVERHDLFGAALHRALKPGGVAIVAVWDGRSLESRAGALRGLMPRGRPAPSASAAAIDAASARFSRRTEWSPVRPGDHAGFGPIGRIWDRCAAAAGAAGPRRIIRLVK